jgi:hypothetical protein
LLAVHGHSLPRLRKRAESKFRPRASLAQILAFLQPGYNAAMTKPENGSKSPLSLAGGIAIAILVLLLAWAIWYALGAWDAMRAVHLSSLGWVFLVLGALVTFLVGAGLMALVFYSSRHDMDR